jgi:predicted nuclease of predicted toxin-antitoxin system
MIFWADESVDFPIITELRGSGHILKSVLEKCPGITDEEVLGLAVHDKNVLLTCDKDFGELIYRHKKTHYGIILIRLESLKSVDKGKLVSKVITERNIELENAFTVIGEKFIRIRK